MPHLRLISLLVTFALVGPAAAAQDLAPAWRTLTSLTGTWKLADPKTAEGRAFRISYRLISANTALVESFGDPARQITQTIYHLDGKRLLATHYCAQGNQPRLRLRTGTSDDTLLFEFLDATNLKSVNDAHLVRMKFKLSGTRHLTRQEVYLENGKEDESTLSLERAE